MLTFVGAGCDITFEHGGICDDRCAVLVVVPLPGCIGAGCRDFDECMTERILSA